MLDIYTKKVYKQEIEMLNSLKEHYMLNNNCEPDYAYYLIIKDYTENSNLLFLKNIYNIYTIKDLLKKLLELDEYDDDEFSTYKFKTKWNKNYIYKFKKVNEFYIIGLDNENLIFDESKHYKYNKKEILNKFNNGDWIVIENDISNEIRDDETEMDLFFKCDEEIF